MLQRLGSWLRAAGYDTLIETDGRDDYELLKQAIAEGRLLITRDRKLMEHRRAKEHAILLECDSIDECIADLSRQVDIDWLHHPFNRCMVCNTPLQDASDEQVASLPQTAKQSLDVAFYCPTCKKVYWEGGHVHRMRDRLSHWQHQNKHNSQT